MNLNTDTQGIHRDDRTEHEEAQGILFPDRWLRIGFTAQNHEVQFNNLLCHINEETLREAFNALDGSKALGIDGISKAQYGKNLMENLRDLTNRIHIGSYKPQSKREVLIPKANGKTRPIAISCFEDKLVEWVVGKILERIYEPLFIRNSFGFRPGKSVDGAIKAVYYSLKDNRRPNVVEIDFASFFNSIPHRKLIKIIRKRISDRRFKGLIGRFLKVGILEQTGTIATPEQGTPQGSIMSPILANIYLHEVIDAWFMNTYASTKNTIVRYADDAVFFFKDREEADTFVKELFGRVQIYGLSLNEEKTKIINFDRKENNSFDFLGFTFFWGKEKRGRRRPLRLKTRKETLHRKIQEFYHWIKEVRSALKTKEIWETAKAKLRGHYNFYGYWMNRPKLYHFYWEAVKSLFKWLNRRSQKSSYSWEQFCRKLDADPLPKPPEPLKLKNLGWSPYVHRMA